MFFLQINSALQGLMDKLISIRFMFLHEVESIYSILIPYNYHDYLQLLRFEYIQIIFYCCKNNVGLYDL